MRHSALVYNSSGFCTTGGFQERIEVHKEGNVLPHQGSVQMWSGNLRSTIENTFESCLECSNVGWLPI